MVGTNHNPSPISTVTAGVRQRILLSAANTPGILIDLGTVRDAVPQTTAECTTLDTVHL